MPAANSEVQELIRRVRATGYKVVKDGRSAHYKVLDPKGAKVIDAHGPVIIASSPADSTWRGKAVRRLIGAGVFKTDPYKSSRADKNGDEERELSPAEKKEQERKEKREREDRRNAARTDGLKERTAVLRGRLEPIIAKLGGWARSSVGGGISMAEFADVVGAWAAKSHVDVPTTILGQPAPFSMWRNAISSLKAPGGTMSAQWLPIFEKFVDTLEAEAGRVDPTESALAYLEMVRTLKGMPPAAAIPPPPVISPAPAVHPDPEPIEEVAVPPEPLPSALKPERVKALHFRGTALTAFYFMARGAGPDDRDEVIELAEKIAALELED